MTGSVIWLVTPPMSVKGKPIDTRRAEDWGRIQIINRGAMGYTNPDDVFFEDNTLPIPIVENLIAASRTFNPRTDYLCMIGDHIQVMQFVFLLAQRYPTGFYILRWDRKAEAYYAIKMLPASMSTTLTKRGQPATLPA